MSGSRSWTRQLAALSRLLRWQPATPLQAWSSAVGLGISVFVAITVGVHVGQLGYPVAWPIEIVALVVINGGTQHRTIMKRRNKASQGAQAPGS